MEFESFPITPESQQDEVVDVTPIAKENRVIITYRTKGVEIYDLKDRSCIKSWTQNPVAAAAASEAAKAKATPKKKKKGEEEGSQANAAGQITFCTQSVLQAGSKSLSSVVNGTSLLTWSFSLPTFGDEVLLALSQQSQQKGKKSKSKITTSTSTTSSSSTTTASAVGNALFTVKPLPSSSFDICKMLIANTAENDNDDVNDDVMTLEGNSDLYAVFEDARVVRIPADGNSSAPTEVFTPTTSSSSSSSSSSSTWAAVWAQAVLGGRLLLLLLIATTTTTTAAAAAEASVPRLVAVDPSKAKAVLDIPLSDNNSSSSDEIAGCDYDEVSASLCVAWKSGRWEVLRLAALLSAAVSSSSSSLPSQLPAVGTRGPAGSLGAHLLSVSAVAWASKDVLLVAGTALCDMAVGPLAVAKGEAVVLAVETVYSTVQAVTKISAQQQQQQQQQQKQQQQQSVTHIVRLGPGATPATVDVALVAGTAVHHAALRLITITLNTAITSALPLITNNTNTSINNTNNTNTNSSLSLLQQAQQQPPMAAFVRLIPNKYEMRKMEQKQMMMMMSMMDVEGDDNNNNNNKKNKKKNSNNNNDNNNNNNNDDAIVDEDDDEEDNDNDDVMGESSGPFEAKDAYSTEWVAGIAKRNAEEEATLTALSGAKTTEEVVSISLSYTAARRKKREKPSFAFVRAVGERLVAAGAAGDAEGFVALWDRVVVKRLFCWPGAPVTYSCVPRLVQLCIDVNFVRGIGDCLVHLRDIPDDLIARLTAYIVALPDANPDISAKKPLSEFSFEAYRPRHHLIKSEGIQ